MKLSITSLLLAASLFVKAQSGIQNDSVAVLDFSHINILKLVNISNLFSSLQPAGLDSTELLLIERMLELEIFPSKAIDYRKYFRQYIAFKDRLGDKQVWINLLCATNYWDWRRNPIIVKGGGSCFINTIINLSRRTYTYLRVNAPK